MKKYLFLILLFCSFTFIIKSQIANPGFENWDSLNGYENPSGWYANNFSGIPPVIKSNDEYPGNYAMNIRSEAYHWEGTGPGHAYQFINISNLDSIQFFIRIDSIESYGRAVIRVSEIVDRGAYFLTQWEDSVVYQNYQLITIPVNQSSDADSIWLEVQAYVANTSLGFEGYSSFHIDGISLSTTVGIEEENFGKSIKINPNPIQESFHLENTENLKIKELMLYDLNGKMVKNFNVQHASYTIGELAEGLYFLRIYTDEGIAVKKLVKSK